MGSRTSLVVLASAVAALSLGGGVALQQASAVAATRASTPIKVATRRLTESQYRHAIGDVFGADIKLDARFEPEKREGGLLAIGDAQLSITPSGFEQYFALAKSVSDQALDPKRRATTVPCQPTDPKAADAACAHAFIQRYGEALFRRPLSEAEIAARVATAGLGATRSGDFHDGLKLALTSLLVAPEFLFRVETAEADPAARGQLRLDGYTKASRISYLLWDAAPDAELLAAAKSGALHTPQGLSAQLDRMAASPRLQDGARAFFTDMLQLDQFEGLTKDTKTYPKFSQALADSAREQTLRTVVDQLVVKKRDYRELFTANETILNRHLAAVYDVPFVTGAEWAPYAFPPKAERSGILTQITFLSLFAHPAASSPTKRGVKVHEIFMCEPTPDPPPNVDFSKVQALSTGTVRTRLLAHMEDEACASCHGVSDPAGLTLEHFDGLGQLRTKENGQTIDVSADLGDGKFTGAQGLGRYLHDSKRVPACLVKNVYSYGVGRAADRGDAAYLAAQSQAFAAAGYRFADLMVRVAGSPEFLAVKTATAPAPATKVAARSNAPGGFQ